MRHHIQFSYDTIVIKCSQGVSAHQNLPRWPFGLFQLFDFLRYITIAAITSIVMRTIIMTRYGRVGCSGTFTVTKSE